VAENATVSLLIDQEAREALFGDVMDALAEAEADAAIERVVRGPGAVVKESPFSRAISVTAEDRNGTKVTLLFPNEAISDEFALALEKFELMMLEHHVKGGGWLAAAQAQGETIPSHWQQLVWLNPKTRQLELIDYVQSSMQGELVAMAIPESRR